jgi:DNA invertase Pin-like site-specific DNA recombinase
VDVSLHQFVAYYRVSTNRQGVLGLGMEAQRAMIRATLLNRGEVVQEFSEVANSTRPDRPVLASALAACRKHRATLIVARLDRLCRNVAFFSALLDSDVQFMAADMPFATRTTLHVMAALAEYEHEAISIRTKEAIRQAKARGRKVGNWGLSLEDNKRRSERLIASINRRADEFALKVYPEIRRLRRMGLRVPRQIAIALEASGISTRLGGHWSSERVTLVELRAKMLLENTGKCNSPQSLIPLVRSLKRNGVATYHHLARELNARGQFNISGRPWYSGMAARTFPGLL